jgi:hypothetical protein
VEVEGRKSVGADGRPVQYERRWRAALNLRRGGRSASWLATEVQAWVWWYVLGFGGIFVKKGKEGGRSLQLKQDRPWYANAVVYRRIVSGIRFGGMGDKRERFWKS